MRSVINRFRRDERGATATEYAMVVSTNYSPPLELRSAKYSLLSFQTRLRLPLKYCVVWRSATGRPVSDLPPNHKLWSRAGAPQTIVFLVAISILSIIVHGNLLRWSISNLPNNVTAILAGWDVSRTQLLLSTPLSGALQCS